MSLLSLTAGLSTGTAGGLPRVHACHSVLPRTTTLSSLDHGVVSERPKERASKAREGATSPWVQIPPTPPVLLEVGFRMRMEGEACR